MENLPFTVAWPFLAIKNSDHERSGTVMNGRKRVETNTFKRSGKKNTKVLLYLI
jgi:hypothetical protein